LTTSDYPQIASSITSDGRILGHEIASTTFLALFSLSAAATGRPTVPSDHRSAVLTRTNVAGIVPTISPDERFIAYSGPGSGGYEIFVGLFPNLDGGVWQISTGGGVRPIWSRDGRELFFLDRGFGPMSVRIETTGTAFVARAPSRVLDRPSRVYVANARSNSVAVIDVATHKELMQIPVGQVPRRMSAVLP